MVFVGRHGAGHGRGQYNVAGGISQLICTLWETGHVTTSDLTRVDTQPVNQRGNTTPRSPKHISLK